MFCAVRGTCRHTAKNICAVCFFSAHGIAFPANLFIAREIYLYIFREILGRAANLRILVNYFAVTIHKGSRQRYLCRDACICRVFWLHFAVTYYLPSLAGFCAVRRLFAVIFLFPARQSFLYRVPGICGTRQRLVRTANSIFPVVSPPYQTMKSREDRRRDAHSLAPKKWRVSIEMHQVPTPQVTRYHLDRPLAGPDPTKDALK